MDIQKTALMLAFLLLGVGMVAAAQINPRVETLTYTCTDSDGACATTADTTSGTCRSIIAEANGGELKVLVCGKDDGRYEMYRQVMPAGSFEFCIAGACLDESRGYNSFTSRDLPPTDDGYIYESPGIFNTSCSLNGVPCTKLSDETAGTCRTVLYDTTGDDEEDLGLLLCHKEDSRYELYRVFYPEGDLYASIGPGFVDWIKGYDSFVLTAPITPPPNSTSDTNETDNTTDEVPPIPSVCIQEESVTDMTATCYQGTITSDLVMGTCREVQCETDGGHLTVLACDKPDVGAKTFFEMYRQHWDGEPVEICLGTACLDSGLKGYQKSEDFC